jgi:hypothetical protein
MTCQYQQDGAVRLFLNSIPEFVLIPNIDWLHDPRDPLRAALTSRRRPAMLILLPFRQ